MPRYCPLTSTSCLSRAAATAGIVLYVACNSLAVADESIPFRDAVAPFLQSYCIDCHGASDPEGGLSFASYKESGNVQVDVEVWEKALRAVRDRQMPPKDAQQPTQQEWLLAISGMEAELARFDCSQSARAGHITLRRLNRNQYDNTIRDLVGIDFHPANDFPSDDVGEGFDNIGEVLSLSPILLEKYLAAAETIADKAFADEQIRDRLFPHRTSDSMSRFQAAKENLRGFASQAFRRPATEDEVNRLWNIMKLARRQGAEEEDQLKIAMQAILTSPHFLFIVEDVPSIEQRGKPTTRPVSDFELASRLSYFLWSSMPDAALRQAADAGNLQKSDVLRAQVRRMLRDDKAQALVKNFGGQWLQLRSLPDVQPDRELFPEFNDALRSAMQRETEMFFTTIIREDRSVLDFLTADFTYVNAQLARHYDMPNIDGDHFRRVPLSDRRRGVLTQASVLLITSNPTRTSPVKRGKWILDNILGEPPPPPPAGVEELDEDAETLGSLRQRMEQHRSNEACAVCHRKMDALGFGLENFDVTGAWRTQDGRFAIDAAGTLPNGETFRSPKQLMEILATQQGREFCRCLIKKMLTYGLGRGLKSHDRCAIDTIEKQLVLDDYRFSTLVTAIVLSDPFRLRDDVPNR